MKVGFVGVGKLGKDAAEVLSEFYDVTGYDINPVDTTINMSDTLEGCVKDKDIVLIAVPTQHHIDYDGRYATSHLEPKDFDYTIAISVTKQVDQLVDKDTLIVMISTMLPGTVRREIAPLINNGRFIYNPYLIAQGTVKFDMRNPEMIMIGTEDGSKTGDAKMLSDFYQPMLQNSPRVEIGTWEEMESTKVFYNTFITAKLCLVNMIQDAAMAVGHMNVDVVTDALKYSTDRIMGPKYMTAGLGDGGGCHPRDNIALRSFAERHNFGYDLFDAIMKAREEQANNIAKHFEKVGVSKDMPCVVLGSGFKPGLAHQQEGSPSILVGFYLEKLGYTVTYDEVLDQPAAYMLGWPKYFDDADFARGSIVVDPWRGCNKKEGVTVYHYGDTRNNPLGLVDLYNGRVYEDEDIN
jgi:UDPglucose 6-dehydrogenase